MNQRQNSEKAFRILVPVGEPDHLAVLLAIATPLARSRHGHIIVVYVGESDSQPAWLVVPDEAADTVQDLRVIHRHDIGNAILDCVRDIQPDLLILHWKGKPSRGRYLLGKTLDPVIQYASCDVAVVHVREKPSAFREHMAHLQKLLIPYGPGPNASLALEMALDLAPKAQVTPLRIASHHLGPTAMSAQWDILHDALEEAPQRDRLQPSVIRANSIAEGIRQEAQRGYDMVLIGATRESLVDRLLFGNLPQDLAITLPNPIMIVRRRDPLAVAALRQARWRLLGVLPQLTTDERLRIYHQVRRNARTRTDFYVLMTLSTSIAALGLLMNSPAVIIGAMVIAPLMASLLGIGLAIVQGDPGMLRTATRTLFLGVVVALGVGILTGLVVPGKEITPEMLGRSRPTLLDLAVALLSGAAAAYATCRRDVASALPGTAIAVALVPPLATVGLAIVSASQSVAFGAALLFATNLVAIISAAGLIFFWIGFHPESAEELRGRTFRGGLMGTLALLVSVGIVLGVFTANSIRQAALHRSIESAIHQGVAQMGPDVTLMDWEVVEERNDALGLAISVRATRAIAHSEVVALQERLAIALQRTVSLATTIIPTTRLDPFVPPTFTPTATPSPSMTPLPTATPTATPTFSPTYTPSAIPSPSPEATITPTRTTSPTLPSLPTDTPADLVSATPELADMTGALAPSDSATFDGSTPATGEPTATRSERTTPSSQPTFSITPLISR